MRKLFSPVLPVVLALLAGTAFGSDSRPLVELYVMSHCPFGTQAEDALLPVLKDYAGQVELKVGFIGGVVKGADDGEDHFSSLHGRPEVDENIRQICARDLAPDKWLDYILARNKNIDSKDWRTAAEAAGIDVKEIEVCSGGLGIVKYTENLSLAATRKISSSPTIYIDGTPYTGPRTKEGFEWEICSALKKRGSAPETCKQVLAGTKPQGGPGSAGADCGETPNVFNVRVVTEKGCAFCAPGLEDSIRQNHPGAKIVELDAASTEGRALLKKHGQNVLPLYVLDKEVENEKNFKGKLDEFYSLSAGEYVIRPGPDTYTPSVRPARERVPGHLDIFVEALSPGTARVAGELADFILNQSSAAAGMTLSWHLVTQEVPAEIKASDEPSGSKKPELRRAAATRLTVTGGDAEVAESIRQACLFQYAPFSEFMAYLNCLYYNPSDPARGKSCFEPEGRIKECVEGGEGERFLKADARLAAELELKAPALLWENRYGPFRWGAADWREMISGK